MERKGPPERKVLKTTAVTGKGMDDYLKGTISLGTVGGGHGRRAEEDGEPCGDHNMEKA